MSSTKFIVVDSNKVLGVFDGTLFGDGRNCIRVPDDCPIQQGQDVREYTSDWELRPLADRVADGLIRIDPHYEVVGDSVRPKSLVKLIFDGLEEIPAGCKMVSADDAPESFPPVDGYSIVPLTPYELMAAGKIDKPQGFKLVKDESVFGGLRLDPMTLDERVAAGELTERDLARGKLTAEMSALLQYLEDTGWYAERDADYRASNGAYGKPAPVDVLAKRQEARDRVSAIRVELVS